MGWNIDSVLRVLGLVRTTEQLYTVEATVPGIAPADAFDANDAVGSVFPIDVPVRGEIKEFRLIDPDDDTLALTAHFFTAPVVGAASDAAFTIAADDSLSWVTSVTFDAPLDIGGAKVAEEIGSAFYYAPKGILYCQCSTTGTPTIAAGRSPRLVICIRPLVGE